MSTTDNVHPSAVEASEELLEITGGGLRVVEIGVAVLLGLLVCPPLLILAAIVVVPAVASALVAAAIFSAVALPVLLVRRVRAHHRAHGSTLFLHRLRRS